MQVENYHIALNIISLELEQMLHAIKELDKRVKSNKVLLTPDQKQDLQRAKNVGKLVQKKIAFLSAIATIHLN